MNEVSDPGLPGSFSSPPSSPPAPKRFKRKLTTFLCQEMLYDYATGQLDFERNAAVEEFVQRDRECQLILEGIRASLEYTERLSLTRLPIEIESQLRQSENAISLGRRYSKWKAWPETMRWSIMAVGASMAVAITVALVPWQSLHFNRSQTGQLLAQNVDANGVPGSVEVAKIPNVNPDSLKDQQEGGELDGAPGLETSGDESDAGDVAVAEQDGDDSGSGDNEDAAMEAGSKSGAAKSTGAKSGPVVSAEDVPNAVTGQSGKSPSSSGEKSVSAVSLSSPTLPSVSAPLIATRTHPHDSNSHPSNFIEVMAPLNSALAGAAIAFAQKPPVTLPSPLLDPSLTSANGSTASANRHPVESARPVVKESAHHASVEESTDSESGGDQEVSERPESKPKGFVFRAFMNLHDLDVVGPKVTQLIQEMGGEKAGEVELGWKRGNSVRYYHFSLPEDNQEKLIEQLQTYGPVRISKDPHPRVMPSGQVRFILWIESAN